MFRFFKRLFIARPGSADARNLPVRDPAQLLNDELLLDSLAQKEASNDLKFITPARCAELFHDWRAGKMGDVQRIFDQLEQFDDSLFACVRARQGALEAMPWSVIVDADAVGEDARLRRLAESQKQLLLARLGAVENLEEAVTHLGLADFRGVAALCIQGNERRMRWTVIEPWLLARPSRALPWRYNPTAETSHSNLQALRAERLILREASPIDLPALFLIVSKYHAQTSWDSFLDFFGTPSIFLEMPGATDQAQAARFDAIVKKLVAEGRGTIPQGANFHTVETQRDNSQAFADRARWCSDAILTLGTGGKLTVTTEANSGTLAGNAHQESFERLCAASARSISRSINLQFCRRILREAFPDQPQLALFQLAPEKEDDRASQAQIIATLSSAGFRPSAETVSEMMGFEVQAVSPPPSASSPLLPTSWRPTPNPSTPPSPMPSLLLLFNLSKLSKMSKLKKRRKSSRWKIANAEALMVRKAVQIPSTICALPKKAPAPPKATEPAKRTPRTSSNRKTPSA